MSDAGSDDGSPRYQVVFQGETEVSKYLKQDGEAQATHANGDTYTGTYLNGKRHGRGKYVFANGATYEGDYVEGVKDGQGQKNENACCVPACWIVVKRRCSYSPFIRSPSGSMLSLDGSLYIGGWKNDKREGEGTYQYAKTGDWYQGEWKNNVKHGRGTYFYKSNGSSITGEWSNGQIMHGQWTMADGSKFIGAWHKNIPSGTGLHAFANGNQATGKYSIERKIGYKWNSITAKVSSATDSPPGPVAADPLKVAQRFIEKCVLKIDHFEGIGRQFKLVDGAPNYRRIPDQNIFACGQPTLSGFQKFFEYSGEQFSCDKFVWINLRAEPIVYVNENSFIPRSKHALNTPMSLAGLGKSSVNAPLLNADQLAQIESQLVTKLTFDISHRGNLHTYLKDTFAELPEDRKNISLSEEVRPNEEGSYAEAIRTPQAVYENLAEEQGVDVEYKRLPMPSDRLPSLDTFDSLIQLIKQTDPSTGLVFNDQMGRGRATYGSILATLMRRTGEALAGADERENTALGRTDIEGLDLLEYDPSDPNYKWGQYSVIMKLVKYLPGGDQIKAEVDDAIERCKVMHHAREAIQQSRERLEKDLAALASSSSSGPAQAEVEARTAFWTAQAQNFLERYAYLLIFQAYVKANIETEYEQQTFKQFVESQPELKEIVGTREQGPIKEFKWQ
jgi:hypothetical protein